MSVGMNKEEKVSDRRKKKNSSQKSAQAPPANNTQNPHLEQKHSRIRRHDRYRVLPISLDKNQREGGKEKKRGEQTMTLVGCCDGWTRKNDSKVQ